MFIYSLNVHCVGVMFNNHYNNFLAYTSQIWPVIKRHSQSNEFVSTEIARKRQPKIQADLKERILKILAHLRYPIKKSPPSSQDAKCKSINIPVNLFRKNDMKLKQNFHGGTLQAV